MDDSMHVRIAADIRRRVLTGDLPVGEAVPSESQLCGQWGASRGPVRQALGALRAEGLIGGGRGKPPVVLRRTVSQPFETFMSFSHWVTTIGGTPGQRTMEIARRPATELVADALGLAEGTPVVQLLRLRLIDDRPAMIERTTFVEPVGRLLFDFDCDSGSIYAYLAGNGVVPPQASHTIDAVAADSTDESLLDVPWGSPLLRERRLASTVDGEPVEYSDDRYRPDIVSFSIQNSESAHPAFARMVERKTAS